MNNTRYCFKRDDDGHNYMIPVSMSGLFSDLLINGEDDCYAEFNNTFMEYSCGSFTDWTFENPEEGA